MQIMTLAVTGHDAAAHFRATPAGGEAPDVIDTRIASPKRTSAWTPAHTSASCWRFRTEPFR